MRPGQQLTLDSLKRLDGPGITSFLCYGTATRTFRTGIRHLQEPRSLGSLFLSHLLHHRIAIAPFFNSFPIIARPPFLILPFCLCLALPSPPSPDRLQPPLQAERLPNPNCTLQGRPPPSQLEAVPASQPASGRPQTKVALKSSTVPGTTLPASTFPPATTLS